MTVKRGMKQNRKPKTKIQYNNILTYAHNPDFMPQLLTKMFNKIFKLIQFTIFGTRWKTASFFHN